MHPDLSRARALVGRRVRLNGELAVVESVETHDQTVVAVLVPALAGCDPAPAVFTPVAKLEALLP